MNKLEKVLNFVNKRNTNIFFSLMYILVVLFALKIKGIGGLLENPVATILIGLGFYSVIGMFHLFCLLTCHLEILFENKGKG